MTQTYSDAWQRLEALAAEARDLDPRTLLAEDPDRAQTLTLRTEHLWIDCSKQAVGPEHLRALGALAEAAGLAGQRDAMLRGEPVNATEARAAMHVALRTVAAGRARAAGAALPAPPKAFAWEAAHTYGRMRERVKNAFRRFAELLSGFSV